MGAPFRELFVELSEQALAIARGIGEQAVRNVQRSTPRRLPSASSGLISATNNGRLLGEWLCDRFGWRSVTLWRDAARRDVMFMVKLSCGHNTEFPLSEILIESARTIDIGDLIGDVWECAGRHCYCTPRPE